MSDWIAVAPVAEFAAGSWRKLYADGTAIVVFNVDGEFHAIENVCTHDGGELTGGAVVGDVIVCPRHSAKFCVKTGEALTAPAYEPTARFPTRIANGVVEVRDDRWD